MTVLEWRVLTSVFIRTTHLANLCSDCFDRTQAPLTFQNVVAAPLREKHFLQFTAPPTDPDLMMPSVTPRHPGIKARYPIGPVSIRRKRYCHFPNDLGIGGVGDFLHLRRKGLPRRRI